MLSVRVCTIATGRIAQNRFHRRDLFRVVGHAGMREQIQAHAQLRADTPDATDCEHVVEP